MIAILHLTIMVSVNADAHLFCMWKCNDPITWAVSWPNGCYNIPKCSDTYRDDNQQSCGLYGYEKFSDVEACTQYQRNQTDESLYCEYRCERTADYPNKCKDPTEVCADNNNEGCPL